MRKKGSGRISVIQTPEDEMENFLYLYRWVYKADLEEDLTNNPKLAEDRLVGMGRSEYAKCPKTENMNPNALYQIYRKRNPKGNVLYEILKGLGFVAMFPGITPERILQEAKERAGERHCKVSELEKRREIFTEFVETKKFPGRKIESLAANEFLSIRDTEMYGKMGQGLKSGSMATLCEYYKRKFPEKLLLFAILDDLGIAQRLGITEEMANDAVYAKMSEGRRNARMGGKQLVVVDIKHFNAHVPETRVLPPLLDVMEIGPTTRIEIILETDVFISRVHGGERQSPLIDQAINALFGNVRIEEAGNAQKAMESQAIGSTMVIRSPLQLDEIYQQGINALGWEIQDLNLQFRTGQADIDNNLRAWKATRVRRERESRGDISEIFFRNQLYPLREAAHEVGMHIREAKHAATHYKMHLGIEGAVASLNKMRTERLIDMEAYNYLLRKIKKIENELEARIMPERAGGRTALVDLSRAGAWVARKFMWPKIQPSDRARLEKANQRILTAARVQ